jgi:hypothetical protein
MILASQHHTHRRHMGPTTAKLRKGSSAVVLLISGPLYEGPISDLESSAIIES